MDYQKAHRSVTEIDQQNEYTVSTSPTKTCGSMGNNTDRFSSRTGNHYPWLRTSMTTFRAGIHDIKAMMKVMIEATAFASAHGRADRVHHGHNYPRLTEHD